MPAPNLRPFPREFEVTREFEADSADPAELESLHDKLMSADVGADVKHALGRSVEQLSNLKANAFIRAIWARFRQFVQRRPVLMSADRGSGGPVSKSEITRRYATDLDG
jgi:hypothetical protein